MSDKKIGIVTVTFNSGKVLQDFFGSISKMNYDNYELIVIDNASKDSTISDVKEFQKLNSKVILVSNSDNRGVAEGNNQGIKIALENECDYIVLLNNDTVFEADLFSNMVNKMESQSMKMAVPKMLYFDEPNKLWCAGGSMKYWQAYAVSHHGLNEFDSEKWSNIERISYSPTCCMVVSRDVFEKIGLMDPDYFVYCDDTDFCIRAQRAGIQLWYLPVGKLWHKVSALTGKNSPFSIEMSTRNRIYMIRKFANLFAIPFHYLIVQADFIARIFIRGERGSEYVLRQKSFAAGLRMRLK